MEPINFEGLIGETVVIISDVLDREKKPITVTIRGVESWGIWIEFQEFTDSILKLLGREILEATPTFFLPFSAISWAFVMRDVPSISSEGMSE
jgi:hypothetical protein